MRKRWLKRFEVFWVRPALKCLYFTAEREGKVLEKVVNRRSDLLALNVR